MPSPSPCAQVKETCSSCLLQATSIVGLQIYTGQIVMRESQMDPFLSSLRV